MGALYEKRNYIQVRHEEVGAIAASVAKEAWYRHI
jgi:thiamine pyrophosphate-dependent acetolactate synthase large subunit-like protein